MKKILTSLAILILMPVVSLGIAAQKPAETLVEKEAAVTQLIEKNFDRWDHNHNGVLELSEVDRQIENHNVHGRQAAVIFQLRRRLAAKDAEPRLARHGFEARKGSRF